MSGALETATGDPMLDIEEQPVIVPVAVPVTPVPAPSGSARVAAGDGEKPLK